MSNPTTVAPFFNNVSTVALPIPEAAPVTIATWPKSMGLVLSFFNLACSNSQYSTSKISLSGNAL